MTFSPSRVRAARLDAGLSQREVAEKAGLSLDTVARTERGDHDPGATKLGWIAEALGVHPGQFFHEPDATPATNGAGQVEPVTP